MSEIKDVLIVSCPEGSEFVNTVAARLAEEGVTYTVAPSEGCVKAVLAVLEGKNTVNTAVAAKIMEAVGNGIPVFSICPEHECCACSETFAMIKKLFAAEAAAEEISMTCEPVIEPSANEVPIAPLSVTRKCTCGAEIDTDMAFCCACGKKIENVVSEADIVPASKKCSCGAELSPDTLFCWNCGSRVDTAAAVAATPAATLKCACGADILPDTAFCWNCGSKVGQSFVPQIPRCSKCGSEITSGDRFCFSCGAPIN